MWKFCIRKPSWMLLPPRGYVAVMVGAEGERRRRRRCVVPVEHLNHPLFAAMLAEAESEFGFEQEGAIVIPCRIEYFRHAEEVIRRDIDDAGVNDEHHHHHGHHLHAGCFRA